MANFNIFAPKLLMAEGGWSDHRNDQPTNRGITLTTFKKYGHDLNNDGIINKADLRLLGKNQALQIYKLHYWDKIKGDQIQDQEVAETYMDMAVNAGINQATVLLQRELNEQGHTLEVDGIIGPKTLTALNHPNTNQNQLFNDYNEARETFYHTLVDQNNKYAPFLTGWLNRVALFGKKAVDKAVYVAKNVTPTLSPDGKKKSY